MNSARWTAAVLLALLCGVAWGARMFENPAAAQVGAAGGAEAARYQISAYSSHSAAGVAHGCYILDTTTGQVWHARAGGAAEKVSTKLP